jgi:hypothetical protein
MPEIWSSISIQSIRGVTAFDEEKVKKRAILLEQLLKLSRAHLLQIHLDLVEYCMKGTDRCPLILAISLHAERWRSLSIEYTLGYIPPGLTDMKEVLCSLESLEISSFKNPLESTPNQKDPPGIRCFSNAPKLHTLIIRSRFDRAWFLPWTQIQDLTFIDLECLHDLTALLSRCTNVSRVSLIRLYADSCPKALHSRIAATSSPTSLNVTAEANMITRLLASITLPRLQCLSLHFATEDSLYNNSLDVSVLSTFIIKSQCQITVLSLTSVPLSVSIPEFLEIFTCVESLRLGATSSPSDNSTLLIFHALALPTKADADCDLGQILLPNLKYIQLASWTDPMFLLRTLESRCSLSKDTSVATLRRFSMHGGRELDQSHLARLRKLHARGLVLDLGFVDHSFLSP